MAVARPRRDMQVLVHGGAGGQPSAPAPRQAVLDEAVAAALGATTPSEAVVEAVTVLERSARFNAGIGATVQSDGRHRTDAGIMTDDGAIGAVCGVTGVATPVELAAHVRDDTPHVMLGPAGAQPLADHLGLGTDADLSTPRRRDRFEAAGVPDEFDGQLAYVNERFGTVEGDRDTVGAVAHNGETLAAATSTGGRWLALRGRIGDVPQVGCGFHCTSDGAVSTTGNGEAIVRERLAASVTRRLADGQGPQAAAIEAVAALEAHTDATAGVIALDRTGQVGTAYNSARMQTAVGRSDA